MDYGGGDVYFVISVRKILAVKHLFYLFFQINYADVYD